MLFEDQLWTNCAATVGECIYSRSVAKNGLLLTIVVFFGAFVTLMTLIDCFQPAMEGRPKTHCWHCNKKGNKVLTEGTPEYEAFMKRRAEGAAPHLDATASHNHFAIHDSEGEEDNADELKKLLQ